ncbi:Slam-dependent surface lipoprotein [Providencia huaxiensis]|uniref:Transferrin-binding protein-like solute binding protein n=1 Tax=Providencia huaxiensis TaxID=2027290 RepID=A0A8I2ALK8_9GAMM|nr:Slam-dependent surface lipoprotein [Providencia huaxiensis]MBQ0267558.1 transferrin-binding protein-like solute binding protein [Providencia huaxiensis]
MKKLSLITVAVSFSIFSVGVMAETESAQSLSYVDNETNIIVDKTQSTMGPHGGSIGAPGIGSRFMRDGKTISFSGLKNLVTQKPDNVYVLESGGSPHGGMGKFQFSQVADAEVYFGDWSQTGEADDAMHTVYFSGENATTEVPASGQATYTIAGINQFAGEAKQTGWFNADFTDKSYTGLLEGTDSHSMAGDIKEDGKFSGTAIANETHHGNSMGQLFGDNAEQVAGILSYENNRELDTAFGGQKDE